MHLYRSGYPQCCDMIIQQTTIIILCMSIIHEASLYVCNVLEGPGISEHILNVYVIYIQSSIEYVLKECITIPL